VVVKVIESQQIGGETIDMPNHAPVIAKWQQVKQFKLQLINSLTIGQSQRDTHLVDVIVATGEDVLERSQCVVDAAPWLQCEEVL